MSALAGGFLTTEPPGKSTFSLSLFFFGQVPYQGLPMPPALEAWSLNHWTTRGVPVALFKIHCHLGEKIQEPYKTRGS